MRPLPSIRGLEAFVAVAQTGSLSAAASLIGTSLPALSRRLQQLEQEIGLPLLQRLPRGTVLTPAGERYYKSVSTALDAIRIATVDLRASSVRPTIRVSTILSFARSWLIPRLPSFEGARPEVEVELHLAPDIVSLDSGEYDAAIRLAEAGRSSLTHRELFPVSLFPVCTPALADKLRDPDDLRHARLIGPDHRPEFWPEWRAGVGLGPDALPPVRLIDSDVLYETAASGLGVAIGVDPITRPLLAEGRLVRPFEGSVRSSRSFNLVWRSSPDPSRAVRSFCDWLVAEARSAPEP